MGKIPIPEGKKQRDILIYFAFAVLVWLAYYLKFMKFGFYEDDYWFAGIPANSSVQELLEFIKSGLVSVEGNRGRYIGVVLPFILTFINFKIGGFIALYIFGIFLVALNGFLIYKIIKGNFPHELALLTGLIFIVFPGDTTKALIVHIYQLQVSLLFTLCGMLLFIRNKKFFAYLLAFMSLLTYENAFLPFVAVSLLAYKKWDLALVRRLINHGLIIGSTFIILFVVRKMLGEAEVSNMQTAGVIKRMLFSFAAGPLTSIFTFFYSVFESITRFNVTWYLFIISVLFFFLILKLNPLAFSGRNVIDEPDSELLGIHAPENVIILIKALLAGVIISVVGYTFSFTHGTVILKGRMTSVHFGAAFGISLFAASIIHLLSALLKREYMKKIFIYSVITFLSLITSYGMLIQDDFAKSWQLQKSFWTEVLNQCPDLDENTLILVQKMNVTETEFVISYSWPYPLIIENLFDFPELWKNKPKLDILGNDLSEVLVEENSELFYLPKYPFLFDNKVKVPVEKEKIIILQMNDFYLKRLSGPLKLNNGIILSLQTAESSLTTGLTKCNLFRYTVNN